MGLERYRQKRNFRVTPEPDGDHARASGDALAFVVQKHAASRLHYDFRLELDGVLLSWAVPKGPSLDPNDKRLAMQTEDHPIEYGDFEGVIPKGEYGGGTVMVWDRGTWLPTTEPREAYAKGRLKFELHGEKLRGGWSLVRSKGAKHGPDSWLLFKEADDFARLGAQATITEDRANSVLSGRSLDEIAAQADRIWHSNRGNHGAGGEVVAAARGLDVAQVAGAREAPMPALIEPQLASAVTTPPSGDAWIHEIKHDGYRMLCRIESGAAQFVSRTAKDWTATFPSLARALSRLPLACAWLDGEVVVLDDKGRSSFQALQNALAGTHVPTLTYVAFDLLYLDGTDLRGAPLIERKRLLEKLLAAASASTIRYSDHFAVPGPAFLENVAALGLEGMVSKRADRPYQSGRSTAWQKAKCKRRQEMVIGGYTDPEGSRGGFGALLLGVYEPDGTLSYSGKVGSGFTAASLDALHATLLVIERKKSSFRNPPQGAEARRAHWVDPVLVAEVAFTEWTSDATLRHAVFHGLRPDRSARDVMREHEVDRLEAPPPRLAKSTPRAGASSDKGKDGVDDVRLTNPDKLLYPDAKLSKRDLVAYYRAVATWMLPHLRDRPLSLVRCPNGWDKTCFYQKNADESADASLDRVAVPGGDVYMMANAPAALAALVQMGVLEIHPWGSRSPRLQQPDRIVLDLDPEDALPWEELRRAVLVVKALMENLGLVPFLRTTGGKGLHVVVAIVPSYGWEDIKGFTKAIAELLERTFPDRFTSKLLKVSRRNRVFIDYLRNAEGATAIAPYSLRARAGAPVSTPLAWEELDADVRHAHFNARNVPERVRTLAHDPWADVDRSAATLTPALMARVGYKVR